MSSNALQTRKRQLIGVNLRKSDHFRVIIMLGPNANNNDDDDDDASDTVYHKRRMLSYRSYAENRIQGKGAQPRMERGRPTIR